MKQETTRLVHRFLEQSADRLPGKTAIVHENVRATYGEIEVEANRIARCLRERGVTEGDRVALILENSVEYVSGYYGILKAGAVASPLSNALKPDGLNFYLGDLQPAAIISSSKFRRVLNAVDLSSRGLKAVILRGAGPDTSPESPVPVLSWEDDIPNCAGDRIQADIDENSLASIIYTSGSTGNPKGVMLTHGNITANTHSICRSLDLTEDDIQMAVLPFFYVMGKSLLNTHISVGGTVVVNNKFAFPAAVIKQMIEEKVTGFSGVPSTFAYLLNRSPLESKRADLGSLRYCSQAGGHMSRHIKEKLREVLPPHTKIHIMYGATEASARLTCLDPEYYFEKMESIGKPIQGVAMKVMNKDGNELPAGEKGELVASGANIMRGYWKKEEDTAKALCAHGYRTGDMGHMDSDGFFFVEGRRDNLLKVGGHRINPQEVEDALMETNLLVEVAAVGIPDEMLGHKLVAVVVPKDKDGTDKNRILGACAEKLPGYKMPGNLVFTRSLPKKPSGKIDKFKCAELI